MSKQTTLIWKSLEYDSPEHCVVKETPGEKTITSAIIGAFDKKIYKVDYFLKTNAHWETVFANIEIQAGDKYSSFQIASLTPGEWKSEDVDTVAFKGCIDIDISFTPFTNTLPIKRLQLPQQASKEIRLIYFDIPEEKIKPVFQKYTRLSATEYLFENVPNDFEAKIVVDQAGFVINYPSLFTRIF